MLSPGFTLPTLPPPPRAPSAARRWAALSASAALVGVSIGSVYFGAVVDASPAAPEGLARRVAVPGSRATRVYPMNWLSRSHVSVQMQARVAEDEHSAATARTAPVRVALDTGTSDPVLTDHGLARLGIGHAPESPRTIASFTGASVPAFPLSAAVVLDATSDGVRLPVSHHIGGELYGVDVVASPLDLVPQGGAVRLDLEHDEMVRCESLQSCLSGSGFSRLQTVTCPDSGGLFGIRTAVAGTESTLMLDTGGPTVLSRALATHPAVGRPETVEARGSLVGASGHTPAVRANGAWSLSLGRPALDRVLSQVWLLETERTGALGRCFPDGSLGIDAFVGCTLVLADTADSGAFMRCPVLQTGRRRSGP